MSTIAGDSFATRPRLGAFYIHHRQEETSEILDRITHVEMLHTLSPAEVQAIIPLAQSHHRRA
jgi:hypothetical protein